MRYLLTWVAIATFAAALSAGASSAQEPERRVALVIGNGAYASSALSRLQNPARDAAAMRDVLQRLGFDVFFDDDLDRQDMYDLLYRFGEAARGADVGLVYFSGHGLQHQGENYFFPIDAAPRRLSGLPGEAVSMQQFLDELSGVRDLKIAIFDACRDHGLVAQLAANEPNPARTAGLSKGMARPGYTPPGSLIAFATAPGATAADGTGQNSPYTTALIERLATPGEEIRFVFGAVRDDVIDATGGVQRPETVNGLGGRKFYLASAGAPPPEELPSPAQILTAQEQLSALGFDVGRPDGVWGARTESAVRAFQQQSGRLSATGRLDVATREALAIATAFLPPETVGATSAGGSTVTSEGAAAGPIGQAGETFRDCLDCPEMVVIPGGSFVMGSPESEEGRDENEGPQRTVQIQAFALGQYEVTFAEWDACAGAGVCREIKSGGDWSDGDQGWGRGRLPVITVSWEDVQGYVGWLNSRFPGAGYRLPSEAEWEYAARAGTTTAYWTGSSISEEQANFGRTVGKTLTVGSFPPNDFGLYDVHGNVWEWVQDCWNGSYTGGPTNGSAWMSGDCSRAVLRGGSWDLPPRVLRSANRLRNPRGGRYLNVGFRVARTLGFPD